MSEVYRDGYIWVRGAQCERCLLSAHRLVSGTRAAEYVQETRAADGSTFVCHKSAITDEPDAICKAWFEAFADEDWILRLAKLEDRIRFTEVVES